MHDVRIPLDLHHVRELDRAVIGDPADIVASQVHQHDVLGPLLGIGEQLVGQLAILGLGASPPTGPRQRTDRHEPLLDPHQDLGRTADQREIAEREIEQERTGIDDPEDAVDVEWPGAGLHFESLARDDLEDVARLDVLLAMPDDGLVLAAGEIGSDFQRHRGVRGDVAHAQVGTAAGEAGDQLVDAIASRLVGRLWVRRRTDVGLRNDQDRLADVVEQDHAIVEGEREIGQSAIVVGDIGQVLGVAHRIVRRIADSPAGESREPRQGEGPVFFDELLEIAQRILRGEPADGSSAGGLRDASPPVPWPRR